LRERLIRNIETPKSAAATMRMTNAIRLVKKMLRLPFEMDIDCTNESSVSGPNMKQRMNGTSGQ
jgi:hypothetical protein